MSLCHQNVEMFFGLPSHSFSLEFSVSREVLGAFGETVSELEGKKGGHLSISLVAKPLRQ